MISVLTYPILWGLQSIIASLISYRSSAIVNKRWKLYTEMRRQQEVAEAIEKIKIANGVKASKIKVAVELPLRITEKKEWALKELASMSDEEREIIRECADINRGRSMVDIPGFETKIYNKTYTCTEWQALQCYHKDYTKKSQSVPSKKVVAPVLNRPASTFEEFYDIQREE